MIYKINSRIIFETGIVPDNWLMGNIKPIYKNKGDKMEFRCYIFVTEKKCTLKQNFFSGKFVFPL
jgi:hypothetical protein